jgi:hypothetical protein
MIIKYRKLQIVWSMWSDVHIRYMWWIVTQICDRWYSLYNEMLELQEHSIYTKNYFLNSYILYSFLFYFIIIREFKPKTMGSLNCGVI